jgi:hypothetical protein
MLLFLMVLMSLPSLAQEVVEDSLAVVENEIVPEINYLTINTDQQNSMIYINDEFVGFNKVSKLLNVGEPYTWKVECDMYRLVNGNDTMTSGNAVVVDIKMQAAYGILNVTSSPEENAVIFVDNKHVGNTPLSSVKMTIGQHKMLVFKDEYEPYHYDFEVFGYDTVAVDVTMISNVKNISIKAEDNSDIYVDNEFKGVGSWFGNVSYGSHIFEARKISHKPFSLQANVQQEGGNDTILLGLPTPVYGRLELATIPSGASVYVADKYLGKTPFAENLLIGEYELVLKNEAKADITLNVNIEENETLVLEEKFADSKRVFVMTDRSGDSLFVNDKYVGNSPQTLYLTHDVHIIKAVRDKYNVTNELDVFFANDTVKYFVGKEMQIVTDSEKDKVYIDGEKIGKAPCTAKLSYGTHELKIARGKYVYERTIAVEDDGLKELKVELGKKVTIKTTDKGDKVYVDGKYFGKTPLTKYMYYGNREIKIVRDKELEKTHTITVSDDDVNEYTLYIGQLVTLESTKKGDDIYIDGIKKGDSPLVYDMPIGNHEVLVKRHRKTDVQRLYIIKDGQSHFYFKPAKETINEFIANGMKFYTLNASSLQGKYSYGVSWGSYKKVGWHISLLTNFDIVDGEYHTGINQFLTEYNEIAPDAAELTGKQLNSRLAATAGLMFKVAGPVYLKLGGGYAMYTTLDQAVTEEWYKSSNSKDINYNGLLLTGGLQFNLKNLVISTDLNTTQNFEFMEFKVGIGFSKKKNKNK